MEHKSELREKLAELAHSQWAGWMDYLFSKCIDYNPDAVQAEEGAVIIPKWAVERWKGQAKAVYCELTAKEMDSDRTEADKFLAVFNACNDHATLKAIADLHDELVDVVDGFLDAKMECKRSHGDFNDTCDYCVAYSAAKALLAKCKEIT